MERPGSSLGRVHFLRRRASKSKRIFEGAPVSQNWFSGSSGPKTLGRLGLWIGAPASQNGFLDSQQVKTDFWIIPAQFILTTSCSNKKIKTKNNTHGTTSATRKATQKPTPHTHTSTSRHSDSDTGENKNKPTLTPARTMPQLAQLVVTIPCVFPLKRIVRFLFLEFFLYLLAVKAVVKTDESFETRAFFLEWKCEDAKTHDMYRLCDDMYAL